MSEDQDRSEEIEKLVEERVEDLREDLKSEKQKRKALENKVEKIRPNSNNVSEVEKEASKGISRREFLKKAGLGTAGLAALGLSPASALNVRSNDFNVFTDNGSTQYFSVGENGPVNVRNTRLELNDQSITGVGELELPVSEATDDNRVWLDTTEEKLKVKISGTTYTAEIQSTAIPDSVIQQSDHWWPTTKGEGQTLEDVVGTEDISLNFENWISGDWIGGYSKDPTGTDSGGNTSNPVQPPDNEATWFGSVYMTDKSSNSVIVSDLGSTGTSNGHMMIRVESTGEIASWWGDGSQGTKVTVSNIPTGAPIAFFSTFSEGDGVELILVESDGTTHTDMNSDPDISTLNNDSEDLYVYQRRGDDQYYDKPVGDIGVSWTAWGQNKRDAYLDKQLWYDG